MSTASLYPATGLFSAPSVGLLNATNPTLPNLRFGSKPPADSVRFSSESAEPKLNKGQELCDRMIAWYQKMTRESKFAVKHGLQSTGIFGCGYKDKGLSEYSCSEYTREAIRQHGVIKGIWKGFVRILMCNPLTFHFKSLQKFCVMP